MLLLAAARATAAAAAAAAGIDRCIDCCSGGDLNSIKLTAALPKGKLAVKGFTLNKEHFTDTKFNNLQCEVAVFKGVTIDQGIRDKIDQAHRSCFVDHLPVLTTKEMNEKGAGDIARDVLRAVSPAVNTVLSLAETRSMTTASKRKQIHDAFDYVSKQVKKTKTGTGGTKIVDEVAYYTLWYAFQDLVLLGVQVRSGRGWTRRN